MCLSLIIDAGAYTAATAALRESRQFIDPCGMPVQVSPESVQDALEAFSMEVGLFSSFSISLLLGHGAGSRAKGDRRGTYWWIKCGWA